MATPTINYVLAHIGYHQVRKKKRHTYTYNQIRLCMQVNYIMSYLLHQKIKIKKTEYLRCLWCRSWNKHLGQWCRLICRGRW